MKILFALVLQFLATAFGLLLRKQNQTFLSFNYLYWTDIFFCISANYINIKGCKKKDLKCEFEKTRAVIARGIPEINLPPMDPFYMENIKVQSNIMNMVRIDDHIKYFYLTGFLNSQLESFKYN